MSRFNSSQIIIFSGTFLAISLFANLLLFLDQTNAQAVITEQEIKISELENKVNSNRLRETAQSERMDALGGQQNELADIVSQLRGALETLKAEQQQTILTANQTKAELSKAKQRIAELDQQSVTQTIQLQQANITIQNQQRALKAALNQNSPETDSELPSALSSALTAEFPDISVTQTSTGMTSVSIPLERVFTNTELDFADSAESILTKLASNLQQFEAADILVIGHADARPIVSDLVNRYPTNWELSSARASKVVSYLIEQGLKAENLIAAGKSANQPVRDGNDDQSFAVNRRLEIQIRL